MPIIRRKRGIKHPVKMRLRRPADRPSVPDKKLQHLRDALVKYERMFEEAVQINENNERAVERIRTIRHQLITSRTLAELLDMLIRGLNGNEVHHITITLAEDVVSPRSKMAASLPVKTCRHIRFVSRSDLEALFPPGESNAPYIGAKSGIMEPGLFEEEIRSCVLAPMIHRKSLIGCLVLGSRFPDKYSSDTMPDLLEDLAITAALCIDNVITHERNEQLATTDPLTGSYNRRFFYEQATQIMKLAQRHGDDLSCLYLDLNNFKTINDTLGHDVGDLALKKLVHYLKSRIRRTDILARLGGDEFVVLLPRVAYAEASLLQESLRQGIEEISFEMEGLPTLTVSAALGLASLQPDDRTLEDVVSRADADMYKDKSGIRTDPNFMEDNARTDPS